MLSDVISTALLRWQYFIYIFFSSLPFRDSRKRYETDTMENIKSFETKKVLEVKK